MMYWWSGSRLWLLLHHQDWTLMETPLRYLAVVLSQGEPVTMVLQDQSLHVPQQVTDGVEVGVCHRKTLNECLNGS